MFDRIDSIRATGGNFRCLDASLCDRAGKKIVLGKPSTKLLTMTIVFAILFGLAGARQAHAQAQGAGRTGVVTFFYDYTGSHELGVYVYHQVTNMCGQPPPTSTSQYLGWLVCAHSVVDLLNTEVVTAPFPKSEDSIGNHQSPSLVFQRSSMDQTQAASGAAFTPTLTSNVPTLPFLGNWLVGVSSVPDSANPADITAMYSVALRRQSDCSLDEDYILPTAATPSAGYLTSLTGAQDYFHQLAGLTTTPDVFANGCGYQVLGLPGTGGILLLGATSGGASIAAQLADSGLYIILTDPSADTSKTTQLTNSQNAGFFSAASLRNNGIMDLVETSLTDPTTQKKATAVFLGNGDGTFQPAVYYDVSDNGLGLFTIDDVNGDGVPDIVELTSTNLVVSGVTTLIGKGDGTFTVGPSSSVSGVPSDPPVTGDFNSDGKKDLLVGGTVLFGANDGGFTVGPTNSTLASTVNYLFPSAVGDLRNSGKLDVVVTNAGSVSIFYGNGDGTFATGPSYAALPDYMQVTITDLDGDGNLDIVLGTSTGGIYTSGGYDTPIPMYQILMGRGNGTFVDSQDYPVGTIVLSGLQPEIASADFNGDTKSDVLFVGSSTNGGVTPGSLNLMPGDGKGNLGATVTSSINLGPRTLIAADMNSDGKPDAVVTGIGPSNHPLLAVLINQGNGTFADEQDYALPNFAFSAAVGDFNGDGLMDVAVGLGNIIGFGTSGPTGVYVLFGQPGGTLGTPVQIDSSLYPTGLAAGSLTNDGRSDLVVADQGFYNYIGASDQVNGALHVYLGNADKTFTTAAQPTTTATNYSVASLGDLNNDGKLDLIVAGNVAGTVQGAGGTPTMYTLVGKGDGTFQAANSLALGSADGIGATSISLADFNHDGKLDVVAGNPLDYTDVLLGNGDGTLVDSALGLGQRPATVAAAYLTGKTFPELVVGQQGISSGNLAVLLNTNPWVPAAPTLATSTTALGASATSVTSGTSVTLTATVTGLSGNTTVPTGAVTFMLGTTSLGSQTLNSAGVGTLDTSTLPVGADSITAVYSGDTNFSGSTSPAIIITVNAVSSPAATSTTLTASAMSAVSGTSITFTATVAETSGTGIPTGTVTFYDGTTSLGTGTLSSGTASYSTSSLSVATHSITASYGGDSNNAASTSSGVNVVITAAMPPDFSIAISSVSGTVQQGSSATSTISITPSGGFNQQVSFACSGLPKDTSCSFSPTTVTPSGTGAATSTLTIKTDVASAALDQHQPALPSQGSNSGGTTALAFLGGGGLLGCSLLRRRKSKNLWFVQLGLALMFLVVSAAIGCGGAGPLTAKGAYQVTVTGTAGSTTHSATYSLTVQ